MKRLLGELENLPEAGKKYSGELDSEIFGIDDEAVSYTHLDVYKRQRFKIAFFPESGILSPANGSGA